MRLKGSPVPEGFVACGASGRIANLGVQADAALRAEAARQRRVWNHFLAIQIDTYAALGEFVFYHEMARRLTLLRRADPWIGAGGIAAQQQTLQALESALKDSFPSAKDRKGFPRFRKAEDRRDSIRVPAADARIVRLGDGTVTHIGLPNLPLLRVRNVVVPIGGRITTLTVRMDGDGWRVGVGMIAPPKAYAEPVVESLGVDIGLATLAVAVNDATGFAIEADNPKPLRKALRKLRRAQRRLSRRQKGGVGRRRQAKVVARIHRKVVDLRSAHHHRVSRRIVDAAAHVSVETLSVKGLMRTRLAGSVLDASPGELLRHLRYKTTWAGRGFATLGQWDRSTGCCPDCDLVGPRLELGRRTWTCPGCGAAHDRDHAAARWIDKVGRQPPEPVRPELAPKAQSPKRGSAGEGKRCASARRAPSGPPANIPAHAVHGARASAG